MTDMLLDANHRSTIPALAAMTQPPTKHAAHA
jgi:hypothetical protein